MIYAPTFNRSGGIDCEVDHPEFGRIPFTARQDDPEAYGAKIYTAALAMGPGPYVPQDPEEAKEMARAVAFLGKREFCLQLLHLGILPPAEATAAARGEWPATFAAFTTGLSVMEAAAAEIEWSGAQTVGYSHPMLQALALIASGGDQAAATVLLDTIFGI